MNEEVKVMNEELERVVGGYTTRQIVVTAYSFLSGERYQDSTFYYIVRETAEVLDTSATVPVWKIPNEDIPSGGGMFPLKDSYKVNVPAADLINARQL